MKTIIVLGFGRSGTTWISDINSKATGGLVLFEPLHPRVTEWARRFCYSSVEREDDSELLKGYLSDVLAKQRRSSWLLRNHVPVTLDSISEEFVDLLWRECSVVGLKEIRANFMSPWFRQHFDASIAYVVRHPCAVLASIRSRKRFWEEFSWDEHYDMFLRRTLFNPLYRQHAISARAGVVEGAKTDLEKWAVMWSITHAIVLPQLREYDLPLFFYEDMYAEPFPSARKLFRFLGQSQLHIHPSHIFTPSMTTLRTLHGLYEEEAVSRKGSAFFWENALSETEVDTIMQIVTAFDIDIYSRNGFPAR